MQKTTGRFNRGENAGTAKCQSCGRNTQKGNLDFSTRMCLEHPDRLGCHELAGIDNEHQDGYHEPVGSHSGASGPSDDCAMCHPDDPRFASYLKGG